MECRTEAWHGFHPDGTAVALHDSFADREPHAGSRIVLPGMESLKDGEDSIGELGIESDTVVPDGEGPKPVIPIGGDMDLRRYLPTELDGVGDQILEQLGQLGRIGLHYGQGIMGDPGTASASF